MLKVRCAGIALQQPKNRAAKNSRPLLFILQNALNALGHGVVGV